MQLEGVQAHIIEVTLPVIPLKVTHLKGVTEILPVRHLNGFMRF